MSKMRKDLRPRTVSEGAHVHPHRSEAFQVSFRGVHKGFQTGWKTVSSQKAALKQNIPDI